MSDLDRKYKFLGETIRDNMIDNLKNKGYKDEEITEQMIRDEFIRCRMAMPFNSGTEGD